MNESGSLTVELQGGLANQLFQWATFSNMWEVSWGPLVWDERLVVRPGRRGNELVRAGLATRNDIIGQSVFERMLWRTIGLAPAKLRDYAASNLTISPPRYTCETIGERDCGQRLEAGNHLWARGYFQDPTTFESDRARIREVLRTALEESTPVNSWKLGYEYSAIHVRRGDYIAVQKITERLGVCTLDYFIAAAEDLDPSLPVKVVSDDPDWCAEVLSPAVAAETTTISTGSDLADLLVLMGAREMVLSNSTFSWWGAFAGDAKRVIAPSVWFDAPDAGGLGLTAIADVLRDKVTGRLAGPG